MKRYMQSNQDESARRDKQKPEKTKKASNPSVQKLIKMLTFMLEAQSHMA